MRVGIEGGGSSAGVGSTCSAADGKTAGGRASCDPLPSLSPSEDGLALRGERFGGGFSAPAEVSSRLLIWGLVTYGSGPSGGTP